MTGEEFHKLIINYLLQAVPTKAPQIASLRSEDDLIGSGLVDSHIFVEMCLAIEEKTGVIIDLGELEPEQFSSIGGLFSIVRAHNF